MKKEEIARVAHEVNRAYVLSLGQDPGPEWLKAGNDQQLSILTGVALHLGAPDTSPEESHAAWLKDKLAKGWKHGAVKDVEKKIHPCCVPWDELPQEQRSKDHIFKAVVAALSVIPDPQEMSLTLPSVVPAAGEPVLPVKYVGKRDFYKDGTFGSRIEFERGQTKLVPSRIAALMFNHPDVYVPGEAQGAPLGVPVAAEGVKNTKQNAAEMEELQQVRDTLQYMNRSGLRSFAKTHFNQDLDKDMPAADMRAKVIQLVDQFGLT